MGRYDGAEEHLQRSLAIEKDLKEPHYLAYTYFNLGELHAAKGNAREAKELYRKALRLQEEDGNVWGASLTRLHLAKLCQSLGRTEEAFAALEPGYEAAKALNALSLLRDYAALCAELYEATGENGLQTYYADLRDWFSERLRTSGNPDLPAQTRPLATPKGSGGEVPAPQLSPWRYSVVALLLLLILALLIEIRRLRRKKQPAAGG
jgi:tetratricopeptide (TPR) repeat protein